MATYQIETDKGTYEVTTEDSSSGLTGNPSIDMIGANKDLAQAQQDVKDVSTPIGVLNKVTGWPYTNTKRITDNAGQILNSIAHPVDTAKGLINAATHPVDAISAYIGRYSPDNIKTTLTTDPIGVMLDATMIGGLGKIGINAAKEAIPVTTPEQMVSKAEGITQKILNPSKDVIADSLLKKTQIPAVREAAKVIRKSPNEKALLENLDEAIKTNFQERQNIFESNNYKMTDNHIKDLENFINERKSQGQVTSSEIRQMENVLADEKAWYLKNQDNFDRISGQSRKEYLQKLTETLIEKRADGSNIITQPFRKQALDVLRSGLKKGVEGNDIRVKNLNETYGGLLDAKQMVADQAAIIEQNANKGIVERLLLMAQSATNPRAAAINVALNNSKNISNLSGKVEGLMQKSMKNRIKNIMDSAIIDEKTLGLPYLTPKYLQERQSLGMQILGTKRGKTFTTKGIPVPDEPYRLGNQ